MPEANPSQSETIPLLPAAPVKAAEKTAPAPLPPLRRGLTWRELRSMPLWLGLHFGLCWLLFATGLTDFGRSGGSVLFVLVILLMGPCWMMILRLRRRYYGPGLFRTLIPYATLIFVVYLSIWAMTHDDFPIPEKLYDLLGEHIVYALFVTVLSLLTWCTLLITRMFHPSRADAASLFCISALAPGIFILVIILFFLLIGLVGAIFSERSYW